MVASGGAGKLLWLAVTSSICFFSQKHGTAATPQNFALPTSVNTGEVLVETVVDPVPRSLDIIEEEDDVVPRNNIIIVTTPSPPSHGSQQVVVLTAPDVVAQKLNIVRIYRDNLLNTFSKILNAPANGINRDMTYSLYQLYDHIRRRRVSIGEGIDVLSRIQATSDPQQQLLVALKELRNGVPLSLQCAVDVLVQGFMNPAVNVRNILGKNSGLLNNIPPNVIAFAMNPTIFTPTSQRRVNQVVQNQFGSLIARIYAAISEKTLRLTPQLLAELLYFRPINKYIPQVEESERYLIDFLKTNPIENFQNQLMTLVPENIMNPYEFLYNIFNILSKNVGNNSKISLIIQFILPYLKEPPALSDNTLLGSNPQPMSKEYILLLLDQVIPSTEPSYILTLRDILKNYIQQSNIDIIPILRNINTGNSGSPYDILISILTRLWQRGNNIPDDIQYTIKSLQQSLILLKLRNEKFQQKVPPGMLYIPELLNSLQGKNIPDSVRILVQQLIPKLQGQNVNWPLITSNVPVSECPHPIKCLYYILNTAVQNGIQLPEDVKQLISVLLKKINSDGTINEESENILCRPKNSKLPENGVDPALQQPSKVKVQQIYYKGRYVIVPHVPGIENIPGVRYGKIGTADVKPNSKSEIPGMPLGPGIKTVVNIDQRPSAQVVVQGSDLCGPNQDLVLVFPISEMWMVPDPEDLVSLLPRTELGTLEDLSMAPIRAFFMKQDLPEVLGQNFDADQYRTQKDLLKAILSRVLNLDDVKNNNQLYVPIASYLQTLILHKDEQPKEFDILGCLESEQNGGPPDEKNWEKNLESLKCTVNPQLIDILKNQNLRTILNGKFDETKYDTKLDFINGLLWAIKENPNITISDPVKNTINVLLYKFWLSIHQPTTTSASRTTPTAPSTLSTEASTTTELTTPATTTKTTSTTTEASTTTESTTTTESLHQLVLDWEHNQGQTLYNTEILSDNFIANINLFSTITDLVSDKDIIPKLKQFGYNIKDNQTKVEGLPNLLNALYWYLVANGNIQQRDNVLNLIVLLGHEPTTIIPKTTTQATTPSATQSTTPTTTTKTTSTTTEASTTTESTTATTESLHQLVLDWEHNQGQTLYNTEILSDNFIANINLFSTITDLVSDKDIIPKLKQFGYNIKDNQTKVEGLPNLLNALYWYLVANGNIQQRDNVLNLIDLLGHEPTTIIPKTTTQATTPSATQSTTPTTTTKTTSITTEASTTTESTTATTESLHQLVLDWEHNQGQTLYNTEILSDNFIANINLFSTITDLVSDKDIIPKLKQFGYNIKDNQTKVEGLPNLLNALYWYLVANGNIQQRDNVLNLIDLLGHEPTTIIPKTTTQATTPSATQSTTPTTTTKTTSTTTEASTTTESTTATTESLHQLVLNWEHNQGQTLYNTEILSDNFIANINLFSTITDLVSDKDIIPKLKQFGYNIKDNQTKVEGLPNLLNALYWYLVANGNIQQRDNVLNLIDLLGHEPTTIIPETTTQATTPSATQSTTKTTSTTTEASTTTESTTPKVTSAPPQSSTPGQTSTPPSTTGPSGNEDSDPNHPEKNVYDVPKGSRFYTIVLYIKEKLREPGTLGSDFDYNKYPTKDSYLKAVLQYLLTHPEKVGDNMLLYTIKEYSESLPNLPFIPGEKYPFGSTHKYDGTPFPKLDIKFLISKPPKDPKDLLSPSPIGSPEYQITLTLLTYLSQRDLLKTLGNRFNPNLYRTKGQLLLNLIKAALETAPVKGDVNLYNYLVSYYNYLIPYVQQTSQSGSLVVLLDPLPVSQDDPNEQRRFELLSNFLKDTKNVRYFAEDLPNYHTLGESTKYVLDKMSTLPLVQRDPELAEAVDYYRPKVDLEGPGSQEIHWENVFGDNSSTPGQTSTSPSTTGPSGNEDSDPEHPEVNVYDVQEDSPFHTIVLYIKKKLREHGTLGPDFDPNKYPTKDSYLKAVLQYLLTHPEKVGDNMLLYKLNEYLQSLPKKPLIPGEKYPFGSTPKYDGTPFPKLDIKFLISKPPKDPKDLLSPSPIGSPEYQITLTLLTYLSQRDLLKTLGNRFNPNLYRTKGQLLLNLIKAALETAPVKGDVNLYNYLVSYYNYLIPYVQQTSQSGSLVVLLDPLPVSQDDPNEQRRFELLSNFLKDTKNVRYFAEDLPNYHTLGESTKYVLDKMSTLPLVQRDPELAEAVDYYRPKVDLEGPGSQEIHWENVFGDNSSTPGQTSTSPSTTGPSGNEDSDPEHPEVNVYDVQEDSPFHTIVLYIKKKLREHGTLGPDFDPNKYPTKDSYLKAVLQYLLTHPEKVGDNMLLYKLNEYLQSLPKKPLIPGEKYPFGSTPKYDGTPFPKLDNNFLISTPTKDPKDLLSPSPIGSPEYQITLPLLTYLSQSDLLKTLGNRFKPNLYRTKGQLLLNLIKAALETAPVKGDVNLHNYLVSYYKYLMPYVQQTSHSGSLEVLLDALPLSPDDPNDQRRFELLRNFLNDLRNSRYFVYDLPNYHTLGESTKYVLDKMSTLPLVQSDSALAEAVKYYKPKVDYDGPGAMQVRWNKPVEVNTSPSEASPSDGNIRSDPSNPGNNVPDVSRSSKWYTFLQYLKKLVNTPGVIGRDFVSEAYPTKDSYLKGLLDYLLHSPGKVSDRNVKNYIIDYSQNLPLLPLIVGADYPYGSTPPSDDNVPFPKTDPAFMNSLPGPDPSVLIPKSPPGSDEEIKMKPIRTFFSQPNLYKKLGPNFRPQNSENKSALRVNILRAATEIPAVKKDIELHNLIVKYYNYLLALEVNKKGFQYILSALPRISSPEEQRYTSLLAQYLSDHDVGSIFGEGLKNYHTIGSTLQYILGEMLRRRDVQNNPQLLQAVNYYRRRVVTSGPGAEKVDWNVSTRKTFTVTYGINDILKAVNMDSMSKDEANAMKNVHNFLDHDYQPNVALKGFDASRFNTKGQLLQGVFNHITQHDTVPASVKKSAQQLLSSVRLDGPGAELVNG